MVTRSVTLITACLITYTYASFAANIGLIVMATGKYISFVKPLITSAEKHFCKNHNVTYFIFTDGVAPSLDNVISIYQPRLGWPFDTMMRFESYYAARDVLSTQDYLFACDADMLFVGKVGNEILGERVATQHPAFINQRGTYETNPVSTAYISNQEGSYYFAGGFYGGTSKEVLESARINSSNINTDLQKDFIAIWHDESHWNRYCIDHKPTIILNPSYCYPENWTLPYPKKILALDKNHSEYRS